MEVSLNEKQAADYLGLKVQTMRNYRGTRRGPAYHKLGSRVIYRLTDLENYLQARRIDPEARRGEGS
jgi:hypothetical protein